MMFTCLQENLHKGLGIISKAVTTKSSLPILSNVLISTENGRLKLSATNMETAISTYVGASIDKEGAITIPAKLLRDFISNISQNTISGNLLNETLHISSEKTKSKLIGTSHEEFPTLPVFPEGSDYLELDAKEFTQAIMSVAFSASNEETRPVFTGVLIKHLDNALVIASSDGFRLSEKVIKTSGKAKEFSVIIPAKTLIEIARIFADATEPIKFSLSESENLCLFKCDDTLVSTRIIQGEYPDYRRIIPSEYKANVLFPASELLEAVRLSNVFSKDTNNVIRLRLNPEGNITVVTNQQEAGEHQSQIPAEIDGESLEIAFNSRYLLDFLNNAKSSEKIKMQASGNLSPCVFIPANEESYIHIVMPMQIQ